jgi:hypothetical protein
MDDHGRGNVPNLTIRAADRKDASAITHIYIASWNVGFRGLMPQRQVDTAL